MFKRLLKIFAILPALCALITCAQAAQVLEDGAAGETVMVLTRRLVELGFMGESVSEYDERVISAIGDFQTANGLARTGVADIETQQAMNSDDAVTRQEYISGFAVKYEGRNLSVGSSGDEVKKMQGALYGLGYYKAEPDGKFGEGTRRAVANYQLANGLEDTGIADEATFIRLYEGESVAYDAFVVSQCANRGDSGMHVRSIQKRLIELGYFSGEAAGTYGENTSRAVSRFQFDNDIQQSGNVDVTTYEALFSPNAQNAVDDGSLYPGDSGEEVRAMQQQLAELGFYDYEPDGEYDYDTETAVMLFRAANGMDITENACIDMLSLLFSGSAADASVLENSAADITDEDIATVCQYAYSVENMMYTDTPEEYPGLGFVRHLYSHCGVDIGDHAVAISRMGSAADIVTDLAPGNIVVLGIERNGEEVLRFAVCIGDGSIAWVNDITGVVEIDSFAEIGYSSIYVWKVGQ